MAIIKTPDLSTGNLYDTVEHQTVVIIDPVTGAPAATATGGLTDTQLRAVAVPVSGPLTNIELRTDAIAVTATTRLCLGTQMITGLSAVTPTSLTVPLGALTAEIQADGGVVRMRRDAQSPTATRGWRIDDGVGVNVDATLANVRLLAVSGTSTNVQITYFDRV